jgi:hypothetical protein
VHAIRGGGCSGSGAETSGGIGGFSQFATNERTSTRYGDVREQRPAKNFPIEIAYEIFISCFNKVILNKKRTYL